MGFMTDGKGGHMFDVTWLFLSIGGMVIAASMVLSLAERIAILAERIAKTRSIRGFLNWMRK
jgi:hypothetical protein